MFVSKSGMFSHTCSWYCNQQYQSCNLFQREFINKSYHFRRKEVLWDQQSLNHWAITTRTFHIFTVISPFWLLDIHVFGRCGSLLENWIHAVFRLCRMVSLHTDTVEQVSSFEFCVCSRSFICVYFVFLEKDLIFWHRVADMRVFQAGKTNTCLTKSNNQFSVLL